ncbi:MAG: NifU family protein [Anaerolineae bacterium]|nr:MAG: NifU family protein [Anaerolineae bacterium]
MTPHNHKVADDTQRLAALLENISSYIEQYHGGWVKLVAVEGDVLKVKLGGACEGCSLTQTTLQGWIAGTVRQFFPNIREVVAVP